MDRYAEDLIVGCPNKFKRASSWVDSFFSIPRGPVGGVPAVMGFGRGQIQTGVEYDVKVEVALDSDIRYGEGLDTIKGLPIVFTLQSMTDEVSRIVEFLARDF